MGISAEAINAFVQFAPLVIGLAAMWPKRRL